MRPPHPSTSPPAFAADRRSPHSRIPRTSSARYRGVVAILAMMFLVIFSSLAAAMAIVAQGNLSTAESYQRVNRSLAAAETGMTYFTWQLDQVANTILTPRGEIDEELADEIWDILRHAIIEDIGDDLHYLDSHHHNSRRIRLGRVPVGNETNAPTYRITLQRHPIAAEDYDGPLYQREPYNVDGGNNRFTADGERVSSDNPINGVWIRIRSVGRDGDYSRSIQMDFRIDKKIRYAILSRNRIMIGRNVMIEGSIGSAYTHTNYTHGHPVQMLDDFRGLDEELDKDLDAFTAYLAEHDVEGNNRIDVSNPREADALGNAEDFDLNNDGYVDAYDFFLMRFGDENGGVPYDNFTDPSGNLIDAHLWQVSNEFKYPPGTDFDWGNYRVRLPGDVWRNAQADMRYINDDDMYAKIHGEVILASSREAWQDGAGQGRYQDFFKGPIHADEDSDPLTFKADETLLTGLDVSDFDVSQYRQMAQDDFQQQVTAQGTDGYTPAGSATLEEVPYQAAHPYDFYHRPVYEGYTFENVVIPRGTNALFVNCTFRGVTFVETNPDSNDPRYNLAGAQGPDGALLYEHLTVEVDGQTTNDTKGESNNIRFHDSTFEGIVVTEPPEEFAHMRNKLQFTGRIQFDLDAPSVGENRELFERSTLLAPHYSIDMGTFIDPDNSDNRVRLQGTIVAGVFDIRGQAVIDGSIITTFEPEPGAGPLTHGGSPAAFNTTIGYFSADDGDAEAEVPDGGLGKIIIRYDPERAMPDGINGPIEIRPDMATYTEGAG